MILLAANLALLGVIARSVDRFAEIDHETRAAKATRMLLWAFAIVVVVEGALGAVGLLTPLATLSRSRRWRRLASLVRAAAAAPRRRHPSRSRDWARAAAALIGVFAFRLWSGLHRTTFLYDTLSYHLHVPRPGCTTGASRSCRRCSAIRRPRTRRQPGALVPVPAGAAALGLPRRRRPAAVRGAGGERDRDGLRDAGGPGPALAGALAFLLIPEVWTQMPTAMTDLGFAACLLASLPFALRVWNAPFRAAADLLAAATAIGLAIGTKYAARRWRCRSCPDRGGVAARPAARLPRRRAGARRSIGDGRLLVRPQRVRHRQPVLPVAVPGLHLPPCTAAARCAPGTITFPIGISGVRLDC
jgi:hypothetical protein